MATATIFEKLISLFTAIFSLLGSFSFNTNFERADDEIKFNINANTIISEEKLPNVVNNVNVWSIEGNPFVDAKVNEENNIFEFVQLCEKVLVEKPLFVLLNSYTTGLGSTAMENVLKLALGRKGKYESYEVGLPTKEGIVLPCGNSAMYIGE